MSARKSSARFAWSRFIEGPYDTAVPGEHRRHGGQMIGGAPTQIYASTSPLSRSATLQTVTHHFHPTAACTPAPSREAPAKRRRRDVVVRQVNEDAVEPVSDRRAVRTPRRVVGPEHAACGPGK